MPYDIRAYKSGYRVYSPSGTPLSKKPLSFARAEKQRTAVNLAEQRRKVRGGEMSGLGDEGYALSDADIAKLVPGIKLFRYPEVAEMNSVDECFDKHGRCMLLFLTEDENTGHWVCMIRKGKTIEYFDPYGGYGPDAERDWLTPQQAEALGQDEPILSRLIHGSGYKVKINPYKFQKEGTGMNTCGRHCATRLMLGHLALPQYAQVISNSGVAPDDFVTAFTSQLLRK